MDSCFDRIAFQSLDMVANLSNCETPVHRRDKNDYKVCNSDTLQKQIIKDVINKVYA